MGIFQKTSVLFALLAVGFHSLPSVAQGAAETTMKPKVIETREGAFRCDTAPELLVGRSLSTAASPAILAGDVVDWPEMAWRGVHLLVGSRAELPDLEKILVEYMPRYRLNQLILEIDYHFQFKSHPEVIEGDALTREDCRRLKLLADK